MKVWHCPVCGEEIVVPNEEAVFRHFLNRHRWGRWL